MEKNDKTVVAPKAADAGTYIKRLRRWGLALIIVGAFIAFVGLSVAIGSYFFPKDIDTVTTLADIMSILVSLVLIVLGVLLRGKNRSRLDVYLWASIALLILVVAASMQVTLFHLFILIGIACALSALYGKGSAKSEAGKKFIFSAWHYVLFVLAGLTIIAAALFAVGRYQVNHPSVPAAGVSETPTVLPDMNDNFSAADLTPDFIFNWGIEDKVNVGLTYAETDYSVMGYVHVNNRTWWQPLEADFSFFDNTYEGALRQADEVLRKYGYTINHKTKDLEDYLSYMEQERMK